MTPAPVEAVKNTNIAMAETFNFSLFFALIFIR